MKNNKIDSIFEESFEGYDCRGDNDSSWDAISSALKEEKKSSNFFKRNFAQFNVYYASMFTAVASTTAYTYKTEIKTFTNEVLVATNIISPKSPQINNNAIVSDSIETISYEDALALDSTEMLTDTIEIVVDEENPIVNTDTLAVQVVLEDVAEILDKAVDDSVEISSDSIIQTRMQETPIVASQVQKAPEPVVEKLYVKPKQVVVKKDTLVKHKTVRKRRNRAK